MPSKRNGAIAYATEASVRAVEAQVKNLDTQVKGLDTRIIALDARLTDKIHFVGALVERLDSKMNVYVEAARGEIEATKARWADAARQAETRVVDLEDVVRQSSRSLRQVEKDLANARADIDRQRASMNAVRDDLVKWGFDKGELPPLIAQHDTRFDELERRLAAVEARVRS